MNRTCAVLLLLAIPTGSVLAQDGGDIIGRVREAAGRRVGIEGARVLLDSSGISAVTDLKGNFRFHSVSPGRHRLQVEASGYASGQADSVPVMASLATTQDILLSDPGSTSPPAPPPQLPVASGFRVTREELKDLPVSDMGDVASLVPGISGTSHQGGRPGEQVTVVGGVPLRNAYDASTAALGLTLPLGLVEAVGEQTDAAALASQGALSGLLRVTPVAGGDHWTATGRYEGDGLFTGAADQGYDRLSLGASGALGRVRLAVAADGMGQIQKQAHGAPAGDPLAPLPWELPHNSGEQINAGLTLTLPYGPEGSLQVLGVRSVDQEELFEPAYKYGVGAGPGRRTGATLIAAVLRHMTNARFSQLASLSVFDRDFEQGLLVSAPTRGLGALSLSNYQFAGDASARALDTAAVKGGQPAYTDAFQFTTTPWGVPEFQDGNDPRGDLLWNHTRELRGQVALSYAPSTSTTMWGETGLALTHATGFQRVLAYLSAGDSVPGATAADLSPFTAHLGGWMRTPGPLGLLTFGARLEGTAPGSGRGGLKLGVSPSVSLRAPLGPLVLELGAAQLAQYPDLQFLAPIAFDDSLAAGHYRRASQGLGYELSRRVSVGLEAAGEQGSARIDFVAAALADLVAADSNSLGPDSSRFGNTGTGSVFGVELDVERRISRDVVIDVGYRYETTSYNAGSGFRQISPSSALDQDRTHHLIVRARGTLPAGIRGGLVLQYASGAAFAPVGGTENNLRAPSQMAVDLLLRREVVVGGRSATLYVDIRNLLNRANLTSVRRDDQQAGISSAEAQALAAAGYAADPNPIPYESPYYHASEDLNHNNMIDGAAELMPLYEAAALDFGAPLAAYGPARQVRLGLELSF